MQIIRARLRGALERLRPGRFRFYRMEGELVREGPKIRLLFVGPDHLLTDVCSVFFGGSHAVLDDRPASIAAAYWTATTERRPTDDVAVVDDWRPQSTWQTAMTYALPTLVLAHTEPGPSAEAYLRERVATSHRQSLNRARKLALTSRRSGRVEDLRFFYHELLVPSARARHGDKTHVPSLEAFEQRFEQSQLYFIERGREVLAGYVLLLSRERSVAECWRFGFRPEVVQRDPKLLKALNVFSDEHGLQMTRENGMKTFELGPTPPVLSNGIFQYKRRWGCTFTAPTFARACRLEFWSARKPLILRHRSLLVENGDALMALGGYPQAHESAESVDSVVHELRSACFPGLREVRVVTPAAAASKLQRTVADFPVPLRVVGI